LLCLITVGCEVSWCEQLVELTGIEMTMLVMALRVSEECKLTPSEEVTDKIFTTVRKEHKHGSKFSSSDWAVACRNCNWIDGKTFTQGDAEMVFQQQCKQDKKPNKSKDGHGGEANGKGNNTLWKDSSFAEMLDKVAKRKGVKQLAMIDDVWNAEKKVCVLVEEENKKKAILAETAGAKADRTFETDHFMKSKTGGKRSDKK
jgi:hypothetical protein